MPRASPDAIDHLATAAGLSESERRALIGLTPPTRRCCTPRVFGPTSLTRRPCSRRRGGSSVRADALLALADVVGGEPLGREGPRGTGGRPATVRGERRRRLVRSRVGAARHLRRARARRGDDRRASRLAVDEDVNPGCPGDVWWPAAAGTSNTPSQVQRARPSLPRDCFPLYYSPDRSPRRSRRSPCSCPPAGAHGGPSSPPSGRRD